MNFKFLVFLILIVKGIVPAKASQLHFDSGLDCHYNVSLVEAHQEDDNGDMPFIKADLNEEDDEKVCCFFLIPLRVNMSFDYNVNTFSLHCKYRQSILQPPCVNYSNSI